MLPAIYLERQMQLEASDLHQVERQEDLADRSMWRNDSKQLQAHERLLEARIRLQGLKERLGKQLFPLVEEEKLLSNQYGDSYPSLRELRKKINQIRDLYDEQIKSVEAEIALESRFVAGSAIGISASETRAPDAATNATDAMESNESRLAELIDSYISSLQQDLADLDATDLTLASQYQSMTQRMEQHRAKVRESELYQNEHDHLMDEIALTQRRYDALISQLGQFDINKDYGTYRTTVISPPSTPSRIAPNALMITLTSGMIGLLCVFGWVGCAEIADRTYHNPDAIRDLGLPILAKIPERNRDRKRFQPRQPQTLCTVHEPESADAEAYRSVRTALDCINHTGTNMVIQVTSPMAGDGKSTLAANLAVSIAQSGKRVLLMDTNLRTPTMHNLFSSANHIGLSTLLSGHSTPRDVIREVNTAGLYLLTAGPLPKRPADLIALQRFARFIDWLRDRFQFVIIDTPPILLASESRVISVLSDGVLLTVRSHHNDPAETQQACELLEIAGANVLGVVVNETTCGTCRRRSFAPPQIMNTSAVPTAIKRRVH
ncbi:Exopolysaccharide synthesis protein [Rhodopirellula maiorica SM1]|uniref:Exopolysaccharide synthesis protein n=1 Tax=Rhodopirellula maiorica SM1 TaxID=1265738 RepID=M5S0T6_9BACT|nr:Exopolysaccharide synthesis protein [Rhodopirellula maiorica SM1]